MKQIVQQSIKYWEVRRLTYNLVCALGAWFAWGASSELTAAIDDISGPYFWRDGAYLPMLGGFFVLNVCYSLCYAAEYIMLVLVSAVLVRRVRRVLLVVGCCCGFGLAMYGSSGIHGSFAQRRINDARKQVTMIGSMRQMPNQPVEVTPTAVTPAADAPGAPSAGAPHH